MLDSLGAVRAGDSLSFVQSEMSRKIKEVMGHGLLVEWCCISIGLGHACVLPSPFATCTSLSSPRMPRIQTFAAECIVTCTQFRCDQKLTRHHDAKRRSCESFVALVPSYNASYSDLRC